MFLHNCEAYEQMSPDTLLYEVTCHLPVEEGTPGGLYFGITRIYPGKVGDEYFMTKGHFHANMNRGEYYWGVEGEGRLIMMDQNRRVWSERMFPGSLHYIPGRGGPSCGKYRIFCSVIRCLLAFGRRT